MTFLTSGKRRKFRQIGPTRPVRTAPAESPSFAASPLSAPMHGAFYLDDDLLDGHRGLEGLHERTARAREAFRGVRQRDSAQTLAQLGGSEPDLQMPRGPR